MLKKTEENNERGQAFWMLRTMPRTIIFSVLIGIVIVVTATLILAWIGLIEIDLNALRKDPVADKIEAACSTTIQVEDKKSADEIVFVDKKTISDEPVVNDDHSPIVVYNGSLFVEEYLAGEAFIPTDKAGNKLYGTVAFDIPGKEVKLTAFTDGYVDVYFNLPGQKDPVVVFTDHEDWYFDKEEKIHVIGFYASDWKKINKGPIKKGGEIGIATTDKDLFTDTFSEKANFSFSAIKWWRESSDKTSDNPSEYMTELMKSFGVMTEEI
jgi:hypothetical protein